MPKQVERLRKLARTTQFAATSRQIYGAADSIEELAAVLRAAVAAAQPLPAPLGPPLSEHVDTWPQWVVDARALLAKVDA